MVCPVSMASVERLALLTTGVLIPRGVGVRNSTGLDSLSQQNPRDIERHEAPRRVRLRRAETQKEECDDGAHAACSDALAVESDQKSSDSC